MVSLLEKLEEFEIQKEEIKQKEINIRKEIKKEIDKQQILVLEELKKIRKEFKMQTETINIIVPLFKIMMSIIKTQQEEINKLK